MRETRQNEPITSWNEGDNVSGFALVSRKELRQDRNNKDFLDLELKDASGSMVGKAWSDSAALASEFEAHQFVAFRGQVKRYRDQLQLTVVECRRATDEDRRFGFDESALVPSTREDIDDLWSRLSAIYTGDGIRRPVLRRLGEETLTTLEDRLREHPAAKAIHHAYRGGLLEHTVSMAELAVRICGHYRQIDRDLVLLGVLFHDLGKLEELGAMPANDYTLEGRLVGHVIIGRDLLLERCAAIDGFPDDLRLRLEHLVLSHQGRLEFGSPVPPMTPEAFVLHSIDDLDSKLAQLEQAKASGEAMPWIRALGRFVHLAEVPEDDAQAPPEATAGDAPPATEEPVARPAETSQAAEPEPEPDAEPSLPLLEPR
jgi:3'-5' exoribonuclease